MKKYNNTEIEIIKACAEDIMSASSETGNEIDISAGKLFGDDE